MKVGDVVVARGGPAARKLYCGSGLYDYAICVSVEPFVMVSAAGDMMWTTMEPREFVGLCQAHPDIVAVAVARYETDQKQEQEQEEERRRIREQHQPFSGKKTFKSTQQDPGFPGYPERSGQEVQILRCLTDDEIDIGEVGPMYRIRFSDGLETDVFEDELLDA